MIEGKSVLAIIPARGGSKGVIRKNIRNVAGKPLIAWTIEEAKKSKYIDRLVLSSEDEEIIEAAIAYNCEVPFKRPEALAKDNTPGIAPVLHTLELLPNYDYVVLLQPTSPLRNVIDIDACIELCKENSSKVCVSVTEPDKNPFWMYKIDSSHRLSPLIDMGTVPARRQDIQKVYAINGAIYIAECNWLKTNKTFITDETLAYIMPNERSIDVDTEFDLKICDLLLKES